MTATEDLEDLYENAPCGYVSVLPDARIVKANRTLADWLGMPPGLLVGRSIHDLMSFGARIAFETHLAPLLRLQGFVHELALDLLHADGSKIPVIVNAAEKRSAEGDHVFTRLMLFKAVDRRAYERGLVEARTQAEAAAAAEHDTAVLREQFIAVLGHDLRNPLAALAAGVRMLRDRETLSDRGHIVTKEMAASIARATALIENVLDFARGRLGEGLTLMLDAGQPLTPVLEQVVAEIRTINPDRTILTHFAIDEPIECDRGRMAQLASNLVSNAVTHGAPGVPIDVEAVTRDGALILSVVNGGFQSQSLLARSFFGHFSGVRCAAVNTGSGSVCLSSTRLPKRMAARWTLAPPLKKPGLPSRCRFERHSTYRMIPLKPPLAPFNTPAVNHGGSDLLRLPFVSSHGL